MSYGSVIRYSVCKLPSTHMTLAPPSASPSFTRFPTPPPPLDYPTLDVNLLITCIQLS